MNSMISSLFTVSTAASMSSAFTIKYTWPSPSPHTHTHHLNYMTPPLVHHIIPRFFTHHCIVSYGGHSAGVELRVRLRQYGQVVGEEANVLLAFEGRLFCHCTCDDEEDLTTPFAH